MRRCRVKLADRGKTLPQNLHEYLSLWTWCDLLTACMLADAAASAAAEEAACIEAAAAWTACIMSGG